MWGKVVLVNWKVWKGGKKVQETVSHEGAGKRATVGATKDFKTQLWVLELLKHGCGWEGITEHRLMG